MGGCQSRHDGGGARAHSLKIFASLGGTVSMLSSTCPSARSAAHCTLAGASPLTIMDCTGTAPTDHHELTPCARHL